MPCYDYYDDVNSNPNSSWLQRECERLVDVRNKLEAVLCGVMRVDPKIVNKIDWSEVGITKSQHMAWWRLHKEKDEQRIQRKKKKAAAKRK